MYFLTYCYFVWLVLHRRLNHCINYIRLVVEEKLQNMIAIYSILWFSHKLRFVCSIISPVLYRYRHFCICLSPEALHRKLLKTRLTAPIRLLRRYKFFQIICTSFWPKLLKNKFFVCLFYQVRDFNFRKIKVRQCIINILNALWFL